MKVELFEGDLPESLKLEGDLALDTEAMGLNLASDRLCLLQLSTGKQDAYLVQFNNNYAAPNLKKLLSDASRVKILHFARFDLAMIRRYLGIVMENIFCTKIASILARTYTDSHGLKELCREMLGEQLSKEKCSSDWGDSALSKEQLMYAASDVVYLHRLKDKLEAMLKREGKLELAKAAFIFLNTRVALDLSGLQDLDIFAHSPGKPQKHWR